LGLFQDAVLCLDQTWIFILQELDILGNTRWFAAWGKPVAAVGEPSPIGGYELIGAEIIDPLVHEIHGPQFAEVNTTP